MVRLFKYVLLSFFVLVVFAPVVFAEDITITTYYPSPYGSYNSLLADKFGVGDNNSDSLLTSADVPTATGDVWIKGKLGIGTMTPGAFKIWINGAGHLQAAAWDYSSDRRLKENISYIQSGLSIIGQLKPVKFDYIKGDKKQAGFIAQEVEEVLPDIVTKGADGMLGMKTESIIPYLVKAVQEQQAEIEDLKARLSAKN